MEFRSSLLMFVTSMLTLGLLGACGPSFRMKELKIQTEELKTQPVVTTVVTPAGTTSRVIAPGTGTTSVVTAAMIPFDVAVEGVTSKDINVSFHEANLKLQLTEKSSSTLRTIDVDVMAHLNDWNYQEIVSQGNEPRMSAFGRCAAPDCKTLKIVVTFQFDRYQTVLGIYKDGLTGGLETGYFLWNSTQVSTFDEVIEATRLIQQQKQLEMASAP